MDKNITEETIRKLMDAKGEARGVHFKNDAEFVLKEKGKKGLTKVEEELKKMGQEIEYEKINQFNFYPVGLRVISLLAIKKAFNWPDEKIEELGTYAMKVSWIIRIFMKYFFSIEKVLEETPKTWSKYFTIGELSAQEISFKKKYLILKLENFHIHPIYCLCLKGVFLELGKMILNPKEISCEEIKCSFKKEENHQFLIKWK